jgi:hypothetical protein
MREAEGGCNAEAIMPLYHYYHDWENNASIVNALYALL